jgi:3-methylcrotonyl-CoA carboxylase beta subunit
MCAEGTPQVALVCGSCTAGGAYNPTMSEEAIIVDGIGKIFLGGPPLVKAATGEVVSEEDLGGAFMHSRYEHNSPFINKCLIKHCIYVSFSVSGCTDYFARTEEEAFLMCRDVIESLNMPPSPTTPLFLPPKGSGVSWEELVVGKEHLGKGEVYGVLAELLDGSNFKEFKAFYGPGLITATGYIQGYKSLIHTLRMNVHNE